MKTPWSSLLLVALLVAPAASQAKTIFAARPDSPVFTVFVDKPTGYTFVKMSDGWKFVGAATQEEVRVAQQQAEPKVPS